MSRYITLSPGARADFNAAARWYRRRELNLSRRFKAEVHSMLLRIARHPYAFMRVDGTVRRASMDRFRYYIYFRFNAEEVIVMGITHQRRSDAVWKERSEGIGQAYND